MPSPAGQRALYTCTSWYACAATFGSSNAKQMVRPNGVPHVCSVCALLPQSFAWRVLSAMNSSLPPGVAMKQRILGYRKAPVTQAQRSSVFHRSRVLLPNSVADLFTHRLIHTSDRGQLHLLPPLGPVRGMFTTGGGDHCHQEAVQVRVMHSKWRLSILVQRHSIAHNSQSVSLHYSVRWTGQCSTHKCVVHMN